MCDSPQPRPTWATIVTVCLAIVAIPFLLIIAIANARSAR